MVHPFANDDIMNVPDPNQEYDMAKHIPLYGNDYSCLDNTGITLLMKLCILTTSNEKVMPFLIEYIRDNPHEINKTSDQGFNALHYSIMNCCYADGWSNIETVQLLLENNIDVNHFTCHDVFIYIQCVRPPLYYALYEPKVCRLLIEYGAAKKHGAQVLYLATKSCEDNNIIESAKMILDTSFDYEEMVTDTKLNANIKTYFDLIVRKINGYNIKMSNIIIDFIFNKGLLESVKSYINDSRLLSHLIKYKEDEITSRIYSILCATKYNIPIELQTEIQKNIITL